jgi:hypothetical protein
LQCKVKKRKRKNKKAVSGITGNGLEGGEEKGSELR